MRSERQQLVVGSREPGEHVLGEVVEEHGIGREQVVDERASVERSRAPRRLDREVHGERPTAGSPHDLDQGRFGRRVDIGQVEVLQLVGTDRELGRRHPSNVAGRPQPGDAHRRLRPAGDDEVQTRRQAEHQRFEKPLHRIARRHVGVIDRDHGVGRDDIGGHRARRRRRARRPGPHGSASRRSSRRGVRRPPTRGLRRRSRR